MKVRISIVRFVGGKYGKADPAHETVQYGGETISAQSAVEKPIADAIVESEIREGTGGLGKLNKCLPTLE